MWIKPLCGQIFNSNTKKKIPWLSIDSAFMKYPTASDIEEMKARGFDPSVIAEAVVLLERGQQAQQLKAAVRKAFAGVTLGTGTGLYEAQGLDDYADEKTCAAYREKDQKDDWSAIDPDELNRCNSSLSFFDAQGMQFHLPAYLIADLDGLYGYDLAFHLTQSILFEEKFALLNAAQRAVIREYLQFIEQDEEHKFDRDHIHRALEGYWAV